jgi:excisionase family DNA binding protein
MIRDVVPPRTIAEAARELGLSPNTIRAWVRLRKITYIRVGRSVRIPTAEIDRLLEEGLVRATA